MHLPGHFRYLEEGAVINKAYMKFNDWAESTGVLFQDWYWNTSGGYRNNDLIYSH
jgi:LruC domain-containing protein